MSQNIFIRDDPYNRYCMKLILGEQTSYSDNH